MVKGIQYFLERFELRIIGKPKDPSYTAVFKEVICESDIGRGPNRRSYQSKMYSVKSLSIYEPVFKKLSYRRPHLIQQVLLVYGLYLEKQG